jgi:hypothetical protein
MTTKKSAILAALVVSLVFAGVAWANGIPNIDRWVISGGGGRATVGSISLDDTIGQWVVGSAKSGSLRLSPGFWGGGWDGSYAIYLPVVLGSFP